MKELALILQLLNFMPSVTVTPDLPPPESPRGSGTLIVAACQPGEVVSVAGRRAAADKRGVARLQVPAQPSGTEPYFVVTERGASRVNGTIDPDETLSAACP